MSDEEGNLLAVYLAGAASSRAEIAALRAEVERLREHAKTWRVTAGERYDEIVILEREVERLRAAVASYRQEAIEAEIASCTECGQTGFQKSGTCQECIAAVDARVMIDTPPPPVPSS
jgi:plasmid stabilization system protein ParE